ncbi:PerC family transcriptional regulator [Acerihabitans arboris]|uniref:PerC family transcriptional regulator n=1 Tax=Acerihabitans arboris TaxID=2691583 RepID=A0A845SVF2_9GAMM|nr:PerC family transcriptional regulator [Acerihabitans arboris]NDL64935.1 PerC family transcriptional regulator [Acerihabitans arboris]
MTDFEKEVALAKRLERSYLWRRAARQWLAVIDIVPDAQERLRDALIARREQCISYGNCFCGEYGGISEARIIEQ